MIYRICLFCILFTLCSVKIHSISLNNLVKTISFCLERFRRYGVLKNVVFWPTVYGAVQQ